MSSIQDTIQVFIVAVAVAVTISLIAFFIYQGNLHDNASQCFASGGQWKVAEKDDGDGTNTQYECVR